MSHLDGGGGGAGVGDATAANQALILGDMGNASASTLGSLYAILGNPGASFTQILYSEIGTVQADAGNSSTQVKTNLASATAGFYNGQLVTFTSGTLAGISRRITDYSGGTKIISFDALTSTPANGVTFVVCPQYTPVIAAGGDATLANQTLFMADLGDASGSTLASIYGILGNPATTITAQIVAVKGVVDTAAADAVLLKADVGDASASTLTSIYGILGNPATTITAQIAAVKGVVDTAAADAVLLKADLGDASASTLTSIYGILGNPATTITAQITDVHGHADTAATQATNAAADAVLLKADVGDASASTLTSIYGILGNPATTITAQITSLLSALRGSDDATNRAVGRCQIFPTTIDLHQAAASYDIATATTQDVVIESIIINSRFNVSDDATITYITIQTNAGTPQVFIDSTGGAKANLTAGGQVNWVGSVLIRATNKIQFTIAGGSADADPSTCDVIIKYRAAVNGGYLA